MLVRSLCVLVLVVTMSACGGGGGGTQPTPDPVIDLCDSYIAGTSDSGDFLCAHNDARASAIPTPVPVLEGLVWNEELATVAQAWAENCTFAHNANRSAEYNALTAENIIVGENVYVSTNPAVNPYDAVVAWDSESQFYDYATNTCLVGEVCGHYTQIVWRDTLQVGCGLQLCGTVAGTTFTNATIMVCNYAAAGNVIGQSPY